MPIDTDNSLKSAFLEGAAKAFFATAFADLCEDWQNYTDNEDEWPEVVRNHRAGPGEDWMDTIPEVPVACYAEAGMLWAEIESDNKCDMYNIVRRAATADGVDEIDVENFGHYMAMEAMGHGVSWWDDHATFKVIRYASGIPDEEPFDVPHHEYSFRNLPSYFPFPPHED